MAKSPSLEMFKSNSDVFCAVFQAGRSLVLGVRQEGGPGDHSGPSGRTNQQLQLFCWNQPDPAGRIKTKLCHLNWELLGQSGNFQKVYRAEALTFVQSTDRVWSALTSSSGAFSISICSSNRVFYLLPKPASLVMEGDWRNSHKLGIRKCRGTERQITKQRKLKNMGGWRTNGTKLIYGMNPGMHLNA